MDQTKCFARILLLLICWCCAFGTSLQARGEPVVGNHPNTAVGKRFPHEDKFHTQNRQPYPNQRFETKKKIAIATAATPSTGQNGDSAEDGLFTSIYRSLSQMFYRNPSVDTFSTGRSSTSSVVEPRQVSQNFAGMTSATQSWTSSGIEMIGILFSGFAQMVATQLGIPETSSSLIPAARKYLKSWYGARDTKEVSVATANATKSAEEKSIDNNRARRQVQPEEDLTNLANVVLSAIQSGECMQRSICLLGSQVGESYKGKIAFIIVDKLLPVSVHGHEYFTTVKNSLTKGVGYCNRYKCSTTYY